MNAMGHDLDAWRTVQRYTNRNLIDQLNTATNDDDASKVGAEITTRLQELAGSTVANVLEYQWWMAEEYARLHKELSDAAWKWIDAGKHLHRPADATEQIEATVDLFPIEPEDVGADV